MSVSELVAEPHDSARLARNLRASGDPRPHSLCDAHAIIARGYEMAAMLRLILAKQGFS